MTSSESYFFISASDSTFIVSFRGSKDSSGVEDFISFLAKLSDEACEIPLIVRSPSTSFIYVVSIHYFAGECSRS